MVIIENGSLLCSRASVLYANVMEDNMLTKVLSSVFEFVIKVIMSAAYTVAFVTMLWAVVMGATLLFNPTGFAKAITMNDE